MPVHLTWGMGADFTGTVTGTVIVQNILATVIAEDPLYGTLVVKEDYPTATVEAAPVPVSGVVTAATIIFGAITVSEEIVGYVLEEGSPVSTGNDITLYRGDDRTLSVSVNDSDGDPVNLTSAKVWFTAKQRMRDLDADAVLFKRNTAAGGSDAEITLTDAANGQAEVYIVPDDSDDIDAAHYTYDVQVTLSSGKTYTVVRGKIKFQESVTATKA
jgi:hypothetical protein